MQRLQMCLEAGRRAPQAFLLAVEAAAPGDSPLLLQNPAWELHTEQAPLPDPAAMALSLRVPGEGCGCCTSESLHSPARRTQD